MITAYGLRLKIQQYHETNRQDDMTIYKVAGCRSSSLERSARGIGVARILSGGAPAAPPWLRL